MAAVPPLTMHAWLRLDTVRRLLPPDARTVLEIGAGEGAVGAELARRYDYLGVEPDGRSAAVAAQRLGSSGRILAVAVEDLPAGDVFDLVCALEVLEHIEDDRAAVAAWRERLRPGGLLLVSVPAGPNRFGASDVRVGHVRRYDREGLGLLLAQAGLEDVRLASYGFPVGYALEVARNAVVRLCGNGGSRQQRTAESGRLYQPSGAAAIATAVAAAPFRVLQRPFAGTRLGTGLVAIGRRPAD